VWAFFFRRVRVFVLAAVLLPVVSSLARRLAERLERGGPTLASRALHLVEGTAGRARAVLR